MTNIFGTKHDVGLHNGAKTLEATIGVPYIVSKLREVWLTNGLKGGRRFTHPA